MTTLDVFTYADDQEIRTVVIDDEPWFVLRDVCTILDIAQPTKVAQTLDDDEVTTTHVIDSMGREQLTYIVSEPGLYVVIGRSRKPEARGFRRWINHEVLPAIRKTGTYNAPAALTFEEMTAAVIVGLQQKIDEAQARTRELESPAAAWHGLSSAEGDFTVSDAAKILARGGVTTTGPRKLYDWLEAHGWVFKRGGRWQAMQSAINAGLLVERVTSGYFDQSTGERKQAEPQVRVTPKGLERLRSELAEEFTLSVVAP